MGQPISLSIPSPSGDGKRRLVIPDFEHLLHIYNAATTLVFEGSNSFGKGFLDLSSDAYGSIARFTGGVVGGVVGGVLPGLSAVEAWNLEVAVEVDLNCHCLDYSMGGILLLKTPPPELLEPSPPPSGCALPDGLDGSPAPEPVPPPPEPSDGPPPP